MSKKFLMILISSGIFIGRADAMNINIMVADELINNQVELSFSYDLYYNSSLIGESHTSGLYSGIDMRNLARFSRFINQSLAEIEPVNSMTGKNSTLTVSYHTKNGAEIFPASCNNIIAKTNMAITISEQGCLLG